MSAYLDKPARSEFEAMTDLARELARELERWTREYCNTPTRTARLLTRARSAGLLTGE